MSTRGRSPIPHPVLDSEPEIELPKSQSIMDPLIVGMDPETGKPLEVSLYDDEYGAHGLLIVAMTGGGKTVLLNCLMERLTACDDVLVWDINLSKGKENRRWAAACDLTAHGPRERAKALQILRLALKVIEYRGQQRRERRGDPRPDARGSGHRHPGRRDGRFAGRRRRRVAGHPASPQQDQQQEAVRGRHPDRGRPARHIVLRRHYRHPRQLHHLRHREHAHRSEAMYAAGDDAFDLPDMSSYGEGHPGVWVIGSVGAEYQTGRTFYLKHLRDLAELAASASAARCAVSRTAGPPRRRIHPREDRHGSRVLRRPGATARMDGRDREGSGERSGIGLARRDG